MASRELDVLLVGVVAVSGGRLAAPSEKSQGQQVALSIQQTCREPARSGASTHTTGHEPLCAPATHCRRVALSWPASAVVFVFLLTTALFKVAPSVH